MTKAILNKRGFAEVSGEITVYNYDKETGEYLSKTIEVLPIGIGIPANSCLDSPEGNPEPGCIFIRDIVTNTWKSIIDLRGKTVYNTESQIPLKIESLISCPDGYTTLKPNTPHDYWNDGEWVTCTEKVRAAKISINVGKREQLIAEARDVISFWQSKLQLDMISDEEKEKLITWLKYIDQLKALDLYNDFTPTWPPIPDVR